MDRATSGKTKQDKPFPSHTPTTGLPQPKVRFVVHNSSLFTESYVTERANILLSPSPCMHPAAISRFMMFMNDSSHCCLYKEVGGCQREVIIFLAAVNPASQIHRCLTDRSKVVSSLNDKIDGEHGTFLHIMSEEQDEIQLQKCKTPVHSQTICARRAQ